MTASRVATDPHTVFHLAVAVNPEVVVFRLLQINARNTAALGLFVLSGIAMQAVNAADSVAAAPLEARMQRIEDRIAIERLLIDYGRTLDNRDFAAYSKLFATNGEWKGTLGSYRGPAAIQAAMEKVFTQAAADIPKGRNFHVMSNFSIDLQGDRATAKSTFIFYKMEGSIPAAAVAGRYEDILIRENGAWRFLQRTALPPG
jgi:3-phenylpropionate/cinnamic acid dioxygenase small subunit